MDIRSAQKSAWDTRLAQGIDANDISLGFCLLSEEVAKALDVWSKGRREVAEELATIAVFLLRLAEMVGTDLQGVVEAKLAASNSRVYGQPPNGVPVKHTAVAATATM